MSRPILTCCLAISLVSISTTQTQAIQTSGRTSAATAASTRSLRVKRAEIMDRNGFERPMVAYTLFVPAGWTGTGAVEYAPPGGCGPDHRINWKATAPDGSASIQMVPEEKWSGSNMPIQDPCLQSPASSTRAYLQWWVQRNRPGARVLDYRARPELLKNLQSLVNNYPNEGMRTWVDAGEMLVSYQVGGRPMRESIVSIGFFIHTRYPSLEPGQNLETIQGSTLGGFAVRMPEGSLDFKTAEALRQSVQVNPEWDARMLRATNERGRIAMESGRIIAEQNRQGAADRSAIIAQTSRDVNQIQMGTWQSRNESMDRTQRETIETVRGVETYTDPHFGGTVQLSNQYEHAWQLTDGSYVLTDDVNFNPARAFGVQGQLLKPAQ